MSKMLPSYFLLAKHYERVDLEAKQASTVAGMKRTVSNACAVRTSYAFNHISGHEIPLKPPGVAGHVWSGVKGNYILGSRGFANYLTKQYGKPSIHKPSRFKAKHKDRMGMVFFDVTVWDDAYGHVALWDGKRGWRGEFFKDARRVWFWEMPSGPGALISATL